MEEISLEQLADLLDAAELEATHDIGHMLIHIGRASSAEGRQFAVLNDALGRSWVAWD